MKARLVWLILCGIWGSTWLFIKLGLADLPPFTFAGIRFVIACAILFSLIRFRRLPLPQHAATGCCWRSPGYLVVQSELRFGVLGRAIHLFRTRRSLAGDAASVWTGVRALSFAG